MNSSRYVTGVITLVVIALLAGGTAAASGVSWVQSDFLSESHPHTPHEQPFTPMINPQPYYPDRWDRCYGGGCQPVSGPYKTDVKTGYLRQGQSATTGYYIPGDRSYIEWILTGPCGEEIIPMVMMSGSDVSGLRTRYCGSDFDLYIYQNRNPRPYGGYADYADTSGGANAYVGVSYPRQGVTYYAQVYAKSGSGHYTLTCRSYTTHDNVVMMQSPEVMEMMYTASMVAPPS